jgi:dihydroflavonol-4-reductase
VATPSYRCTSEGTLRVLLTGGTGFVGSHVARALLANGHETALLVRTPEKVARVFGGETARRFEIVASDMTDESGVARAVHGRDAVVHAAAVVALERKHAARVFRDNRRGLEFVVGNAITAGVERIVYVSSVVALYRTGQPSMTTESLGDVEGSAYTRSKVEGEIYIRSLQATGAPIRTTYPAAIIGPHDPGLSEANRGVLAFFRDAPVVTDTGLQLVDVRDVAEAHARLLLAPTGPGRHLLGGHFVPWGRLVDLLEEVTGRKLHRWPIPGAVMRVAGALADVVKHVWDFQFPLSLEAMRLMTQWVPVGGREHDSGFDFSFRDPRDTLADTLRWFVAAGHLRADRLGKLGV